MIKNLKVSKSVGSLELDISDISYDSRKVKKGDIFVCLVGSNSDGHDYVQNAVKSGAVAVVAEKEIDIPGVTILYVKDTREFLAGISANFFGNPAKKIKTIGITGTKGKTTTSFMIKNILEQSGKKVGIIGTIGALCGNAITKLPNTTPESYEIQKHLKNMYESGCTYCVIEASSIGLKEHRLDGFEFDFGIFTNFSHDHIGGNEHKTMEEYLKCKSMLFKKCKTGFLNLDDEKYGDIIIDHTCKIFTYSVIKEADITAKNINLVNENGNIGVSFDICGLNNEISDIYIPIPGKFNVYNALAAVAVCKYIGIKKEDIVNGLKNVKVKGRMEPVKISSEYSLFIDYAHNALSMENVLTTLKKYNPKRIVTLFGAGGNRPKIRRYEMGEISGKYSDLSVITSDNPRYENPMDIIEDIKTGISKTNGKYTIIPDRKEAIKYCIQNAQKGDIIILAGKGHEDYQEIQGKKYHMDEREIIDEICKELKIKREA